MSSVSVKSGSVRPEDFASLKFWDIIDRPVVLGPRHAAAAQKIEQLLATLPGIREDKQAVADTLERIYDLRGKVRRLDSDQLYQTIDRLVNPTYSVVLEKISAILADASTRVSVNRPMFTTDRPGLAWVSVDAHESYEAPSPDALPGLTAEKLRQIAKGLVETAERLEAVAGGSPR